MTARRNALLAWSQPGGMMTGPVQGAITQLAGEVVEEDSATTAGVLFLLHCSVLCNCE